MKAGARMRLTVGGRWVSHRVYKKRLARQRRTERQSLVHGAGCVIKDCASHWYEDERIRLAETCELPSGVKVPRSLRKIFGFRVAP